MQLKEAPPGAADPANTSGQNSAEGLREDPDMRCYVSNEAVRCVKQENILTYPSPQQYLHLHNWGAFLLRLGHNPRSNDGPAKAVGDGRQSQTSPGPLVPYPSSLVRPDVKRKRCLRGSLDGAAGLGRHPLGGMQPSSTTATRFRRRSPRRHRSRHLPQLPPHDSGGAAS